MNLITDKHDAWKVKFNFLIDRVGTLISQEGKKMALIKYLENKYAVIESVLEDNNFVEFEQLLKEKYHRKI